MRAVLNGPSYWPAELYMALGPAKKEVTQALMGIGTDLLQLTNSCCPNLMNLGLMGPASWTPEMTTKCVEEARGTSTRSM